MFGWFVAEQVLKVSDNIDAEHARNKAAARAAKALPPASAVLSVIWAIACFLIATVGTAMYQARGKTTMAEAIDHPAYPLAGIVGIIVGIIVGVIIAPVTVEADSE